MVGILRKTIENPLTLKRPETNLLIIQNPYEFFLIFFYVNRKDYNDKAVSSITTNYERDTKTYPEFVTLCSFFKISIFCSRA